MTNDPKDPDDDIIAVELADSELENVDGGITLDNGIKRAARVGNFTVALYGNDTINTGVSNDTLFAGFTGDKTFKRR